jgi:hypothetical protein
MKENLIQETGNGTKLLVMMKGSPNLGVSNYQADYILTAPSVDLSTNNISLETFT